MQRIVPFIHTLHPDEKMSWIAAIEQAAPGIALRGLEAMTVDERSRAEVAVAANPTPSELGSLPSLRWIQSLWAGVERLAPHAAAQVSIVRMIDPQLSEAMAEAVLAWTLYLHRQMPAYARQQRTRTWQQRDLALARDVRVGVLGLGEMGRAATRRLRDNGFTVMGWSRSRKDLAGFETFHGESGLASLLRLADIVVLLLPLTDETRGLIGAEAISATKRGASLINFARGAIVDEAAMLAALNARTLDHAVLDVFPTEPLPPDSPLWTHEHVTILPHISAPTNIATASAIAARNLRAYFETGVIPAGVDRARGY